MDYPVRGRYGNAALSPLEDDAMQWLDGFYQPRFGSCGRWTAVSRGRFQPAGAGRGGGSQG